MQFKTSMKMIAGAVTLALSSHVFAQNVAGNGDIYIAIDDTTASTEYLYDTGISASTFAAGSSSVDLTATQGAAGTAFSSFLGSLKSGTSLTNTTDTVTYSVFAGIGGSTGSTYTVLVGSVSGLNGTNNTNGASSGANISDAWEQMDLLLGGNNDGTVTPQTLTGSEYLPASAVGSQWFGSGKAANVGNDLVAAVEPSYGTAEGFYSETTVKPTKSTAASGTATASDGSWDLSTVNGDTVLAFTPSVPLPAPLLLLVSGLGMMGVFGRRRSGTAA